jgi:hypothetical protein
MTVRVNGLKKAGAKISIDQAANKKCIGYGKIR